MSIVTRGRIVRAEDAKGAVPLFREGPSAAQRTRMSQEEVSAHQNADVILNRALTQARAIVDGARADAERAAKGRLTPWCSTPATSSKSTPPGASSRRRRRAE